MGSLAQRDGEVKFKIGLVGESGVGKSCLLVRWVDDEFFEENDKFTIGVDFKYKLIQMNGQDVKLQVYDTAGQERFRTVTASFYRGTHGVLLVFDISERESFEKLEEWLREVRNYTNDNTPVVLVGNKVDKSAERKVTYEEAKSFAAKEGLSYFETSAKDNTGVNDAYLDLIQAIYKQKFSASKKANKEPLQKPKIEKKRRCTIV